MYLASAYPTPCCVFELCPERIFDEEMLTFVNGLVDIRSMVPVQIQNRMGQVFHSRLCSQDAEEVCSAYQNELESQLPENHRRLDHIALDAVLTTGR